ncbi:MAG TPA: hypothetical protein VGQ83_36915 [Polyangia bacterium]|jgi:hypothetical protein
MTRNDDMLEEDLVIEEVERRREPRGLFPGMVATVREGAYAGQTYEVIEASRTGLFLKIESPDAVPLGTRFRVDVAYGGRAFHCDLEIARKEIQPRRGVAGRITAVDDASAATLADIIATAAADAD